MNTPSKEALEASGYIVRSLGITEEDRGLLASIIDRHFEPLRQRTEQAEARVKELQKQEAESRRLFYAEQDKRKSAEFRCEELAQSLLEIRDRPDISALGMRLVAKGVLARHAAGDPEAQK